MTWTIWMAGFIVLLTIAALLKRIETRLVLFVAGLVMALFALSPQTALGAFVANMTNKSLITAICSSMGFAAVIAITRCDVHFVGLMVKPLGRLGIFLLPSACSLPPASPSPFRPPPAVRLLWVPR